MRRVRLLAQHRLVRRRLPERKLHDVAFVRSRQNISDTWRCAKLNGMIWSDTATATDTAFRRTGHLEGIKLILISLKVQKKANKTPAAEKRFGIDSEIYW